MTLFRNIEKTKSPLKYISIGDSVTKNLTVYEYEDTIIAVDYGIGFPESDELGVDFIIPDMTYLLENANKVKGLFISHAHADHYAAVPHLLKKLNVPVYASKITQGFIKKMFSEKMFKELKDTAEFRLFDATTDEVVLGPFRVSAFNVNHSVPNALGIKIDTPQGRILHMADFKIDKTPVIDKPFDLERLEKYANEGVLCLVSDSLGSRNKHEVESEASLNGAFQPLFEKYDKRQIFVTVISSNISRMQQIFTAALNVGRKIVPVGRSIDQAIDIVRELGYLQFPSDLFIEVKKTADYAQEGLIYLIAGCFGQRGSALDRVARGEHRDITLTDSSVVIFSAEPGPPSVYDDVEKLCSELTLAGAEVIDHNDYHLHVSGHGHRNDLLTVAKMSKAKYFIPNGGTPFQMHSYGNIVSQELGVPRDNIFELGEGEVIEFRDGNASRGNTIEVHDMFFDGIGINPIVISDRQTLSTDGVFVVVIPVSKEEKKQVGPVDVITRGFIYVKESRALLGQSRDVVNKVLDKGGNLVDDWGSIKKTIEKKLDKFLYKETGRSPLIIVHSIFM